MAKKSIERQAEKQIKRLPKGILLLLILSLAIGIICGYFTYTFITKKDKFVIVGEKAITLSVGDTYVESGATAICFGKNCSEKVVIEGSVDTTKQGVYVITYTINNLKYQGVKRYRYVTVKGSNL